MKHNITSKPSVNKIEELIQEVPDNEKDKNKQIAILERKMKLASENLLFEEAAKYRDELKKLKRS